MNSIISILIILVFIVLGALYCFGGYKYIKIVMFYYTMLATFAMAYNILSNFSESLGVGVFILSIVLGIIVGALALFFIKFAIFIGGGIVGICIFSIIRDIAPNQFEVMDAATIFVIAMVCFFIMGVVMLTFQKHLLIIFSAIFGGYSLVYFTGIMVGVIFNPAVLVGIEFSDLVLKLEPHSIFNSVSPLVMLIPVAIFAVLGIISQYRFISKKSR